MKITVKCKCGEELRGYLPSNQAYFLRKNSEMEIVVKPCKNCSVPEYPNLCDLDIKVREGYKGLMEPVRMSREEEVETYDETRYNWFIEE